MTGLVLHLRARGVPTAVAAAAGSTAALWALWVRFSDQPVIAVQLTAPAILFAVTAAGGTLGGADEELERTAARPWRPRRTAHLLLALSLVALLVTAADLTATSFGEARLLVRDAAGLLGLAALGAATLGAARAWFAPMAWTLLAVTLQGGDSTGLQIATWPVQPHTSGAAAGTATVLALAGAAAYIVRGARARPAD